MLILTTCSVVAEDAPKPVAKDKEALQGLWQAIELETGGEKAPAEAAKAFQIRIKGNMLVFGPETENREHTFSLDAAAKPKAMDLTLGDGPDKGKKLPCGIYKLDEDKLTICLHKEGEVGKRPTDFKTAPGDGLVLMTFQRVKEKK